MSNFERVNVHNDLDSFRLLPHAEREVDWKLGTDRRTTNIEMGGLSVHDYAYKDIPAQVWNAWEKCNSEWNCYPFESTPWLCATADGLSQNISKRVMVVNRSCSDPVAFWPYAMQCSYSGGVLPIIICRPWAEDTRVAASIIASPELDRQACRVLVHGLLGNLPKWDKMILGLTRTPSSLLDGIIDESNSVGRCFERETHSFAEIRGWSNFNEFLGSLSRDWRRKYNRVIKRIQEDGKIHIEHIDTVSTLAELESMKIRILNIYRESWKVNSPDRLANLAHPEAFAYFSRLLGSFAQKGCLHVVFVTVHGDDAAFYVGVRFEKMYCSLQTAYKEKYASLSMGFLTQIENFRYTIEHDFLTNNLMANQDYKKHFTDKVQYFSSLIFFNHTAAGKFALLMSKARDILERQAKKLQDQTRLGSSQSSLKSVLGSFLTG
jgi:hypothetical protein